MIRIVTTEATAIMCRHAGQPAISQHTAAALIVFAVTGCWL